MHGLSYKTVAAISLCALGLMGAQGAAAVTSDLVVDFENTPLFSEANFLPGDTVTRWAQAHNNTETSQQIVVEAINVSDPDGLGNQLHMRIADAGTTYFDASMHDFLTAGEIQLSTLAEGTMEQYNFSVSFNEGADGNVQGKNLGFDILIGFQGGATATDNPVIGGGGGGGLSPTLLIFNETEVNVQAESVVLTWDTNFNSTSRVVLGTIAGVFDFGNPPNYGYAHSTPEFDTPANTNGVISHSVILNGLTPATTYYYRVISHASPDTVSIEHSFATTANGVGGNKEDTDENGSTGSDGEGTSQGSQQQGGQIAGNQQVNPSNNIGTGDDKTPSADTSDDEREGVFVEFLAASFLGLPGPWWIWLAISALILLWLLAAWKRRKKKEEE